MRRFIITAVAAIASPATASPPPPPPAFIGQVTKALLPTPTAATFQQYANVLADDLTVTLNGRQLARNKAEWLATERARLGKVDRFVYGFTEGRDSVLIVDRFDDKSDEHCPAGDTCVFDPRYVARAVRYEVGADHLVHAIRIVETEGGLRTP